jgi:hypothetical protein
MKGFKEAFGDRFCRSLATGPDATVTIERFRQLPVDVHEHAGGLESELVSYDTIPLPIPPEEQPILEYAS